MNETKTTPTAPPLRRNRDYQILWSGRAISEFGTEVTEIAYPLLMLAITGSAGYAGMLGSAQLLVIALITFPAGVLADHVNRRTMMITCDLARAVLLGGLGIAVVLDVVTIPWIIGTAMASAIFSGMFRPCGAGALKQLVPASQMADAQAQTQARLGGVMLIGPPLGGVLYSLGRAVPFLFDAVSYLAGAIGLLFIRKPLQRARTGGSGPAWRGAFAGVRFMFGVKYLRMVSIFSVVANMMFAGFGLAMIAMLSGRGANPATVGALLSAMGAAGLLGALLSGRIIKALAPATVIIGSAWVAIAAVVGIAVSPGLYLPTALAALVLFAIAPLNTLYGTYLMASAPDDMQGRVSSASTFMSIALQPIGPILIGTLFDTGEAPLAFGAIAALTGVAALLLFSRHIRDMPAVEEVSRD